MKKKTFTIKDNGVYIVYKEGRYEKFNGENKKDDIAMIGIAHDGHTFAVPLEWNYGKNKLLNGFPPRDNHCVREIEALLNWDFIGETEHLKTIGLAFELKKGHFIPTAPVFLAMFNNRFDLNKALNFSGAEEINFEANIWIAQRYNVGFAWIFDGTNGYFHNYGVSDSLQCGAVTLWEP